MQIHAELAGKKPFELCLAAVGERCSPRETKRERGAVKGRERERGSSCLRSVAVMRFSNLQIYKFYIRSACLISNYETVASPAADPLPPPCALPVYLPLLASFTSSSPSSLLLPPAV